MRQILLLGLLCAWASSAFAQQDCEVNGEQANPANGNTTRGRTGLLRCRDRATGKLRSERELRDGAFMGVVRHFDADGNLKSEYVTNARGNHDGRAREFSPRGVVLRDATYRDGATIGIVRTFYASGKLHRVSFRGPSERELAYAELGENARPEALHCADEPRLTPHVPDDEWCGHRGEPFTVSLHDRQGRLTAEVTYLGGAALSTRHYFQNGVLSYEEQVDEEARYERRFYADGKPRSATTWQKREGDWRVAVEEAFAEGGQRTERTEYCVRNNAGRPLRKRSYYLNGQPQQLRSYNYADCDRPLVTLRLYLDTGALTAVGRYALLDRRETPTGVHQSFDNDGQLRSESTYDEAGQLSRVRVWDAQGGVTSDDAVFPDGSRKAYVP